MSSPAYDEYKESDVRWLGRIPRHWDVIQSRRIFCVRNEKALESDRQVTASQQYGILYQDDFVAIEGRKVVETIMGTHTLRRVKPNDFVISLRSFQGGIEWSKIEGAITFHYVVLTPIKHVFEPFYAHLFKSIVFIQALRSTTNLIRDGQDLRFSHFVQVDLPVIPLDEQKAIASFLDVETSKIDGLVSEQRRLIELLKEKRQAVISHAVTKGVNPDAPMRPSGIQWLGDVPQHWDAEMLSRVTTKIGNGFVGPTRDILVESGVPYIQATHIKKGRVNFDGAYYVTPEWAEWQSKAALELEDVLIVQTGAGTGDIGLVSKEEVGYRCHALIIVRSVKSRLLGSFLSTALQSPYGRQTLESIQTGGMHPHLNCGNVKFVYVPIPPMKEQADIVEYLNEQSAKFDSLVAEAERAIELLQERRTALISAAVTGKIDVREFRESKAP